MQKTTTTTVSNAIAIPDFVRYCVPIVRNKPMYTALLTLAAVRTNRRLDGLNAPYTSIAPTIVTNTAQFRTMMFANGPSSESPNISCNAADGAIAAYNMVHVMTPDTSMIHLIFLTTQFILRFQPTPSARFGDQNLQVTLRNDILHIPVSHGSAK